ncbi:uncharacterized protein isoform X3 [Leptinotarsa decemlineata]|uniref:uncharacterized protein isoform X3 n=1 Tax=Leptinotarsa decemlineata TaxID=7539 RepID=UPI003D30A13C
MEISWKWSSFYLCLLLFQLCNGIPINSENTLTDEQTKFITGIVSILLTVCGLVMIAGCLCCRWGNSFKEFRNSPVAVSISSQLDHGHVNPIANGEFTIFTPLSPPHFNNNIFLATDQIKVNKQSTYKHTRTLESDSEDGLINSWFSSSEKDFPRIKLKYIRELGKGWFGKVVEGAAQDVNNESNAWTPVVVRILDASSSQKEKILFLQDAAIYKCGSHGNILKLIGRCLDTVPYLLLQEYCPQGDLKGYLRSRKPHAESFLTSDYPLLWCCQITSALKHLHDNNISHPDLASRNCQLTSNLTLKLGDYGLGVFKYPNDYYQSSPGVSVRWCAPEALTYTQTTIQPKPVSPESNVWSLGVTMWEICECGEQPYSSLSDDEVISQVLGPANLRLSRPSFSVLYTDYIFRLMQLCWTNADSRPTLTQIDLMLADLLQVHRNTNPNASQSLLSSDDFDERWESFKPNSIVKTDHVSDSVSIDMHYPETKIRKSLSASLHNLHGSFEDLLVENGGSHILFVEDELRNTGFSSANEESLTSERIFNSDSSDQESTTNKSKPSELVGLENNLRDSKLYQRTSSGSETEDENWRNKVERGAYTEKVRLKSRSVADLMILTHVDYSESESETPLPSLEYKVNNYKNVRLAPSNNPDAGNVTFGSEGNLLSIKDTFQEELKKLQEERKDSLLFVPDNISHSSFRVDENIMGNQSNINNSPVTNSSRLIQDLNSPIEIKPAGQVFNVFNVTIDKYSPLNVNTKLTEIINFDKVSDIRLKSEERDLKSSAKIIKTPDNFHEYEVCDKLENISSEDPWDSSKINDTESNLNMDLVRKGSDSSQEDAESNGTWQKLPESYQNETELNLIDSLEDGIDIICNDIESSDLVTSYLVPENSEVPLTLGSNMPLENTDEEQFETVECLVDTNTENVESNSEKIDANSLREVIEESAAYVDNTKENVGVTQTEQLQTNINQTKKLEDSTHEKDSTLGVGCNDNIYNGSKETSKINTLDGGNIGGDIISEEWQTRDGVNSVEKLEGSVRLGENVENVIETSKNSTTMSEKLQNETEEENGDIVSDEYISMKQTDQLSTDDKHTQQLDDIIGEPNELAESLLEATNVSVGHKLMEASTLEEENEGSEGNTEVPSKSITPKLLKSDITNSEEECKNVVETSNENVIYKSKEIENMSTLNEIKEGNESIGNIIGEYEPVKHTKPFDDCTEKLDKLVEKQSETTETLVEAHNENVDYKLKEVEGIQTLDKESEELESDAEIDLKMSRKDVDCTEMSSTTFDNDDFGKTIENIVTCNENSTHEVKEFPNMNQVANRNENMQFISENVHLKENLSLSIEDDCNEKLYGEILEPNQTCETFVETCNENINYKQKEVEEIGRLDERNVECSEVINDVNPSQSVPDSTTCCAEECEPVRVVETCNENVIHKVKEIEDVEVLYEHANLESINETREPLEAVENLVETCTENIHIELEDNKKVHTLDEINRYDAYSPVKGKEYTNLEEELSRNVKQSETEASSSETEDAPDIKSDHSCDKIEENDRTQDLHTKCVNFDLSTNQKEAMPNSLTHSVVFASTPFKKREISLPVEDTFSSINLFGDPKENGELDADFSMEFSRLENFPPNKDLNYSLETWDNFLGSTFDHQNNVNENLFDSFSSEPKSLLFVDNEEISNRESDHANEVLLNHTVVLHKNNEKDGETTTEVRTEPNATYVMDEKTEKTFVIDEKPSTSEAGNNTFVKESSNSNDQNVGSWENGGGWFLHPQTTNDDPIGEMQIQNSQTESYVGFGIDDEIMSAIRNELLSKLPHAQGSTSDRMKDDEFDSGERNEVFLRYNVYNTPLSPIPEESYVEEQSGMEYLKQERENEDSDWSDRCLSDTLAPDTDSQSAVTLESHFRGPHHRHTPSQDSCCSNDTLFNLEELNCGTTEPEKYISEVHVFDDLNMVVAEVESNNVAESTDKTFIVEKADLDEPKEIANAAPLEETTPNIAPLEETTPHSSSLNIINDFLVEERKHALTNSLTPEKSNLHLDISQSDAAKTHHVPLPSPEDNPWKQLPASLLSFDKVKSLSPSLVLEGETESGEAENLNTENRESSEKSRDNILVETAVCGVEVDEEKRPNTVPECAKTLDQEFSNDCLSKTDFPSNRTMVVEHHSKNHPVVSSEKVPVPESVDNLESDILEKPIQGTDPSLTVKEIPDERLQYENIKVEGITQPQISESMSLMREENTNLIQLRNEEPHNERTEQPTYVNIGELESSVQTVQEVILPLREDSDQEPCYNNCRIPEYVNVMDKELKPVDFLELGQGDGEPDYANCAVENTEKPTQNIGDTDLEATNTEDIYENINDETDPYNEYVNIVNMENTKNSLEYNHSDKENEIMDVPRYNEDDTNSDNDSNIFGVLTDIRFSGPSDSQLMSTSFSENNCEEQEWDSGSDSRSSSSGEFIWKMENIKPMEGIAEDAYEESDISSTFSDEEGETPEFVPSAWDKFAIPGKSVLRSPEKIVNKSEEKKPKGVWFKKQKYHCIYEYPKEPESPVLQSHDLWKPQPDFKSFADWEFDGEPFLPQPIDDNETFLTYSNQTNRKSNSQNLYQLTSIPDFVPDDVDGDKSQEFFITGSSQPFHSHNLSSQFFPGHSNWNMEHATPDSGVEDVTPGSLIDSKYSASVDSVPTLKQLASDAVNRKKHSHLKTKDVLGGLRHTRNKLKLDLPPSPSAFSSERMFVIEPAPEPVVVREKPTFTTFGKSRFLVQHVDTPPDDSKSRNVSFEALPYKPIYPELPQVETQNESDRFIMKADSLGKPNEINLTKDDHSNLCHMKIEVVKGEASVLDSGDEDSGIESSTLERKVVKNTQA